MTCRLRSWLTQAGEAFYESVVRVLDDLAEPAAQRTASISPGAPTARAHQASRTRPTPTCTCRRFSNPLVERTLSGATLGRSVGAREVQHVRNGNRTAFLWAAGFVVALVGCAAAPPPSPFQVSEAQFRDQVKRVALAPIVGPPQLGVSDSTFARNSSGGTGVSILPASLSGRGASLCRT